MDLPPDYDISPQVNQNSQVPVLMRQVYRRNSAAATVENYPNHRLYTRHLASVNRLRQNSIAIGHVPTNALPTYQDYVFSSVKEDMKCRRKLSLQIPVVCIE